MEEIEPPTVRVGLVTTAGFAGALVAVTGALALDECLPTVAVVLVFLTPSVTEARGRVTEADFESVVVGGFALVEDASDDLAGGGETAFCGATEVLRPAVDDDTAGLDDVEDDIGLVAPGALVDFLSVVADAVGAGLAAAVVGAGLDLIEPLPNVPIEIIFLTIGVVGPPFAFDAAGLTEMSVGFDFSGSSIGGIVSSATWPFCATSSVAVWASSIAVWATSSVET